MGRLNGKDSITTGDAKAPSWPRDKDGNLVDAWNHGGGAPWQTASFDVDNNTVAVSYTHLDVYKRQVTGLKHSAPYSV